MLGVTHAKAVPRTHVHTRVSSHGVVQGEPLQMQSYTSTYAIARASIVGVPGAILRSEGKFVRSGVNVALTLHINLRKVCETRVQLHLPSNVILIVSN